MVLTIARVTSLAPRRLRSARRRSRDPHRGPVPRWHARWSTPSSTGCRKSMTARATASRAVDHRHIGAQADGHFGRVRAGHAAARITTFAGETPGTPPSSTPNPPLAFCRQFAPPGRTCDPPPRSWREQRQRPIGCGHGLVGDGGGSEAIKASACSLSAARCRYVKSVCPERSIRHSAAAAPSPSRRDPPRRIYRRLGGDGGARRLIMRILESDARSGAGLHTTWCRHRPTRARRRDQSTRYSWTFISLGTPIFMDRSAG